MAATVGTWRRGWRGAGVLALGLGLGCGEASLGVDPAGEAVFLRGRITRAGDAWGYLVAGTPGPGQRDSLAYVRVGPGTALRWRDGRPATTTALTPGQAVTVWTAADGFVLDSYPVQVQARALVLEPGTP